MNRGMFCAAAAIGAMLFAASALARDWMLLGGYAGTKRGAYGYLGAIVPVSDPSLDKADWLARLWLAHVDFEYLKTPTQRIEGKGPIAEAAVGYRAVLGANTRMTGYLGLVHRDIKLSPDDPLSRVDDRDSGVKAQLEFASRPTPRFDLWAVGSYTGHLGDKYFRVRPGYAVTDRIVLGPEYSAISGDAYSKRRFGLSLEGIPLGAQTGISFQLGREKDRRNNETNSYAGASFTARF